MEDRRWATARWCSEAVGGVRGAVTPEGEEGRAMQEATAMKRGQTHGRQQTGSRRVITH
jgi:hypothetical protein